MKLKLALWTATALGLLMSSAMADSNRSVTKQTGDDNTISVNQNGSSNVAGDAVGSAAASRELRQTGNNNAIEIIQTGYRNTVAGFSYGPHGAWQTGSFNQLTITQESRPASATTNNGNIVESIRQDSNASATAATNIATVTQTRGALAPAQANLAANHRVGVIDQDHTGGAANTLTITQTGAWSTYTGGSWPYSGQNNHVEYAVQNGSGNTATISQSGTGPGYTAGSAAQVRGPANTIVRVDQQGDSHIVVATQAGHQNYIQDIRQSGNDNYASVVLQGNFNGATPGTANGARPALGVLGGAGTAAAAAASVDALAGSAAGLASSVEQAGTQNAVNYWVNGADGNQFGFWQYGHGNQAVGVQITGVGNHLGVYQSGEDNVLSLAAISGDDNHLGLIQKGKTNLATVTINGSNNGGFNGFVSPIIPASLTAGLIEQDGDLNVAALTVNGSDNVFGTLQRGNDNTITGAQTGAGNQAGVAQIGNTNTATFSQIGSGNVVSIQQ
jgi:hypothetical protein